MTYGIQGFTKTKVRYTDDAGVTRQIIQRQAVAQAVENTPADDTEDSIGKPVRWTLRHIYLQSPSGPFGKKLRKRVVITDDSNPYFNKTRKALTDNLGNPKTLDGISDWVIEGTFGEVVPKS